MPVTHKTQLKLTPKQRTMFEGQRKKAQGLMEKEDKEGRGSGKAYAAAKRAYERAGRLLYGAPKETTSPGKSGSTASDGVRGTAELAKSAIRKVGKTERELKKVQEIASGGSRGGGRRGRAIPREAYEKYIAGK
ncbi:hypothetical protein LCGC14_1663440 [marine sediment metagenome]|uniref:Uncharacterized protein n=1 Tax=marine sediment metagenome TaxID=412755 RepID=A0A0F9HTF3_9ZZZZ